MLLTSDSTIFSPDAPALALDESPVRTLACLKSPMQGLNVYSQAEYIAPHCKLSSYSQLPSGSVLSSGPTLYESLLVFPNSTKFVVTVNMGNDTISIARDEIAAAIQYIGWDRIRAIERKFPAFMVVSTLNEGTFQLAMRRTIMLEALVLQDGHHQTILRNFLQVTP